MSYRANTVASLLVPESRKIAALLMADPTPEGWRKAVYEDNLLQKRSPRTAMRIAGIIRERLKASPREALPHIVNGTYDVAAQLLLAGAIKCDRLLADFLRFAGMLRQAEFRDRLSPDDFYLFLHDMTNRDPKVADWTPETRERLYQIFFKIMVEARLMDGTRSRRLLSVRIEPEVMALLRAWGEDNVIRCLEAQG